MNFIILCRALDDFLNELAGGQENRSQYIQYNAVNDIHDVIVVHDGDKPIGCANFKMYNNECADVKQVFIENEYRGRGRYI